jgi:hypothetical protein
MRERERLTIEDEFVAQFTLLPIHRAPNDTKQGPRVDQHFDFFSLFILRHYHLVELSRLDIQNGCKRKTRKVDERDR